MLVIAGFCCSSQFEVNPIHACMRIQEDPTRGLHTNGTEQLRMSQHSLIWANSLAASNNLPHRNSQLQRGTPPSPPSKWASPHCSQGKNAVSTGVCFNDLELLFLMFNTVLNTVIITFCIIVHALDMPKRAKH